MSFYRSMITTIAAVGLATSVFAADENNNPAQNPAGNAPQAQAMQTADASNNMQSTDQSMQQDKVDLNKATAKELAKVKGISMGKAKAIVAYRKKHGDFKSLDDLKDVKAFKKMNDDTMKQIQDQLTLS